MKELRQIKEGMTGYQASQVIYGNDKLLDAAIRECRTELDANKAYVAQLQGSDKISLDVAQKTGSGTTTVMSQNAVTEELDKVNEALITKVSTTTLEGADEEIIGSIVYKDSAEYAKSAATDGKGESISGNFEAVKGSIQGQSERIEAMQTTIADLQGAIEELKKKSWPDLEN